MISTPRHPRSIGRAEWIRRCSLRIRALDDVVTLVDAADLATTLQSLPCCKELTPEQAAARLFQDDLTPSQWNNGLATLCERSSHLPPHPDADAAPAGCAGLAPGGDPG